MPLENPWENSSETTALASSIKTIWNNNVLKAMKEYYFYKKDF